MILISPPPVDLSEIEQILSDVYQVKAESADHSMHTGDTVNTILKSFLVPGGALGNNGVIRLKAGGISRGNGGNKDYELKFGSSTGFVITIAPSVDPVHWMMFATCHNLNDVFAQHWTYLWFDGLTVGWNETAHAGSQNTGVDKSLELKGKLSDVGDEVECNAFTVEINPTT